MVVGVLHLSLLFHDTGSLKQKRGPLRQVIARIRNNFDVAVAEVGAQDLWQRAEIGIAAVGNDRAVLNHLLDRVLNFVDAQGSAEVIDHRIELINL